MSDLYYGIYRGICKENEDPENYKRIKLLVPQVLGSALSEWAWPCLPVTSNSNHPDHQEHTAAQIAALAKGLISFDGDPRSHQRPLAPVIKALESLGVSIEHQGRYSLPLVINGAGYINGGEVEIDASASSQFLSSLLLVAPLMKQGLKIKNVGKNLPSKPHIEMTIAMLAQYGAVVDTSIANQWSVKPTELSGVDLVIEPDLSNAAVFMAAPILCGGEVIIKDWPRKTTQPGDQLRQIFSEMGGVIDFVDQGLRVRSSGQIRGIDIDLGDAGELTPVIAALACFANSPSHLRGIGHLRLHETDRLSALKSELTALGAEVIEEESALRIHPQPNVGLLGKGREYSIA